MEPETVALSPLQVLYAIAETQRRASAASRSDDVRRTVLLGQRFLCVRRRPKQAKHALEAGILEASGASRRLAAIKHCEKTSRPPKLQTRTKITSIPKARSVKNRAYSVLYSANLCIRTRFGTMSRAGVPGAAERCGRALPEEQKALPAGRRSRPLRRRAPSRNEPKRALATRQPRAAARASCAPRVVVLRFCSTARPTSDSRRAGWRPRGRCLAPDGKHTRTQTR